MESNDLLDLHRKGGWGLYTINDRVVVDDIFLYEDLSSSIRKIESRLGLNQKLSLPLAKADSRSNRNPVRQVLTGDMIDKISKIFSKEIELLGYQLDN